MRASPEGLSVAVIWAASGTGRTMAHDVAASSAGVPSLAALNATGPKRVSGRLPGKTCVKTLVNDPSDASAAAMTGEAERAPPRKLLGLPTQSGSRRAPALWKADCTTGMRSLRSRHARLHLVSPLRPEKCRNPPHDAPAGILVPRKPSCEAATTLKGSRRKGMGCEVPPPAILPEGTFQ